RFAAANSFPIGPVPARREGKSVREARRRPKRRRGGPIDWSSPSLLWFWARRPQAAPISRRAHPMRSARAVGLFALTSLLILLPMVAAGPGGDKPKDGNPGEGAKDDKGKGEDKAGKEDKAKAEDKGGPPTMERYIEVLKSGNVLVRRRVAMVLMTKGPDAY